MEEDKSSSSSGMEEEIVHDRIFASMHLIKVKTEPPVYLSTSLIYGSNVLTNIAFASIKDTEFETNQYGDRCLLCLNNDNIPYQTWVLLGLLADGRYKNQVDLINNYTIDDLMYICLEYDITFSRISEVSYSMYHEFCKLPSIILDICRIVCKQYFPRTQNISELNISYNTLGRVISEYMVKYKKFEEKMEFLTRLEIVPLVHHAVTSALTKQLLSTRSY